MVRFLFWSALAMEQSELFIERRGNITKEDTHTYAVKLLTGPNLAF